MQQAPRAAGKGYYDPPWITQGLLVLLVLGVWTSWVGYKTRLSTAVVAITYTAVHLLWGADAHPERIPTATHMSQALIILALSPSGRSLSVDRWLEVRAARRRGERAPAEEGPLWTIWLMVLAMSCMYAWSGLAMLDGSWLAGDGVAQLWISHRGTSDAFASHPQALDAAAVGVAWVAALLCCGLALGLLIPRLRHWMVVLGLLLHGGIWFVWGGWPFTAAVAMCYVVLIDPARVHDFVDTVFGVPRDTPESADPSSAPI